MNLLKSFVSSTFVFFRFQCADGSYPTWASSDEDIETVETFNHQMFCTRITNWKDPVWMNKDSTVIVKRNQSITCNNFSEDMVASLKKNFKFRYPERHN